MHLFWIKGTIYITVDKRKTTQVDAVVIFMFSRLFDDKNDRLLFPKSLSKFPPVAMASNIFLYFHRKKYRMIHFRVYPYLLIYFKYLILSTLNI